MTIRFSDNVKYTATAAAGNVDMTVGTAVVGYFTHPTTWVGGSGTNARYDQFFYKIEDGTNIEIGVGTQYTSATTWRRGTVLRSTNNNTAVTFPTAAGAVTVSVVLPSYFLDKESTYAPDSIFFTHPLFYYVDRINGSDSYAGTTSATAFATVQKAVDVATAWRCTASAVTIYIIDETYTESVTIPAFRDPATDLRIEGNTSAPANVVIRDIQVEVGLGKLSIKGVKVLGYSNTALQTVSADTPSGITGNLQIGIQDCIFNGNAGVNTVSITSGASAQLYRVATSGSAYSFLSVGPFSSAHLTGAVTVTGTPAYEGGFVAANAVGPSIITSDATFTGSATGPRYIVGAGGIIQTFSAGASYFPGNSSGVAESNGIYL